MLDLLKCIYLRGTCPEVYPKSMVAVAGGLPRPPGFISRQTTRGRTPTTCLLGQLLLV